MSKHHSDIIQKFVCVKWDSFVDEQLQNLNCTWVLPSIKKNITDYNLYLNRQPDCFHDHYILKIHVKFIIPTIPIFNKIRRVNFGSFRFPFFVPFITYYFKSKTYRFERNLISFHYTLMVESVLTLSNKNSHWQYCNVTHQRELVT